MKSLSWTHFKKKSVEKTQKFFKLRKLGLLSKSFISHKQRHLAAKLFTKTFWKLKNKLNRHQNQVHQVNWTLGSKASSHEVPDSFL